MHKGSSRRISAVCFSIYASRFKLRLKIHAGRRLLHPPNDMRVPAYKRVLQQTALTSGLNLSAVIITARIKPNFSPFKQHLLATHPLIIVIL